MLYFPLWWLAGILFVAWFAVKYIIKWGLSLGDLIILFIISLVGPVAPVAFGVCCLFDKVMCSKPLNIKIVKPKE